MLEIHTIETKMPSILIVEKLGSIKVQSIKTYSETELYKKAGFKAPDGFKCQTTWQVEMTNSKYSISLYGKTTGRANQENKYEFPPPVDKCLYFGNCILVNKTNGVPTDFSIKEWEDIYEQLYGGFEDIDMEDSDDDEDMDDINIPNSKIGKSGYLKDDFVVDDDMDDDMDDDLEDVEDDMDDDADDDDEENTRKRKTKGKKSKTKDSKKTAKKEFEIPVIEEPEDLYLDCSSELSEESYIE
jgi:hypothetical protein